MFAAEKERKIAHHSLQREIRPYVIHLSLSPQQMKQKLEDELRKTSYESSGCSGAVSEAELARKKAENRLFGGLMSGLTGAQSERIRQEMQRYATMRDPRLR